MKFLATHLQFDRNDPKSIAECMYKMFLQQYGQAVREECAQSATVVTMEKANQSYRQRDEEAGGFGDCHVPYSDAQIEVTKKDVERCVENTKDAEALMNFWHQKCVENLI